MSQSMIRKDGKLRMDSLGRVVQANSNTNGSRQESWATPTVTDASAMSPEMRPSRIATGRTTEYLARQIQWGTPTARDHKSGRGNEERKYKELTPMVERTSLGKLNPRWVETLWVFQWVGLCQVVRLRRQSHRRTPLAWKRSRASRRSSSV
jgi:hypothetical protein